MALSIPLSVFTSRRSLGARTRKMDLFLTPEETAPPLELVALRARLKVHEITEDTTPRHPHAGLAEAVLDPYVNAIHVSLLREKQLNPVYAEQLARLGVGSGEVRALGRETAGHGPGQTDRRGTVADYGGRARAGVAAPAGLVAARRIARAVVESHDS